MPEPLNKASIWHRVRDEGRLEAFDARREQLRVELKEKGTKRKQAVHEAWRLALAEFPPLPVEALEDQDQDDGEEDDPLDLDYPEELMPPAPPCENNDVMWVYHHMLLRSTQESDAPNRGAWGLLLWARRNRHAFYFQILPKEFAAQEKKAQEKEVQVKSEPMTVQERLRMFEDFVAKCEAETERRGITAINGLKLLNTDVGPPRTG